MKIIESFVENLEAVLGIKRTEISIQDKWSQCPPEGVNERDMTVYLEKVIWPLMHTYELS